jgi:PPM family protein phosphatase
VITQTFLIRQEANQTSLMTTPIYPQIESSGLSHVGYVREENQDSIWLPADKDAANAENMGLMFALADGMGGYSHGSLASQMALDVLTKIYFKEGHPSKALKTLRTGVEAANLGVYKEAQRLGIGRMGTTLTGTVINGRTLSMVHVGDSRAYLVRDRRSVCLTNDHTMVGDLVRMKVLSSDKVRTHAQRSILTKAVGLSLFVQPDLTQHELREDDCLILCSDGVWSVIDDEDFAHVAGQVSDVEQLSQDLINLALDRKTDDNVSVIAIRVHALPNPNGHDQTGSKWFSFLRRKNHAR